MPLASRMVVRGGPPIPAPFGHRRPSSSGHKSDRVREEWAVQPLGMEEDARVHPGAKEGGLRLRPAFVATSPALANGRGRWVSQGRGKKEKLSKRKGGRSGKLLGPSDMQCVEDLPLWLADVTDRVEESRRS